MADEPFYAELSATGAPSVRFEGTGTLDALGITGAGIEGWYSMPAVKVDVTARGQGDGGHDVAENDIMYASRTVTLHWNANGRNRWDIHTMTDMLRLFAHRLVTLRVVDANHDTYCQGGYLTMEQASAWHRRIVEDSTLTIVFERPERLATNAQRIELLPKGGMAQGLSYGMDWYTAWAGEPNDSESYLYYFHGNLGLEYPISYCAPGGDGRNRATMTNNGTSRAYPQMTIVGDFPEGVSFLLSDGSEIIFDYPVEASNPLLLDWRSRTASIGGTDMSRHLSKRGFSPVPPQSSLGIILRSNGTGHADLTCHDTYL